MKQHTVCLMACIRLQYLGIQHCFWEILKYYDAVGHKVQIVIISETLLYLGGGQFI